MSGPPLPPQLPLSGSSFPSPFPHFKTIQGGCWLVNYEPHGVSFVAYDGTIRVEHNASGTTASGDLYQRPVLFLPSLPPRPPRRIMLQPPSPVNGIPIQSRRNYRYYLRITSIPEGFVFGNSFNLGFEMWRFDVTTNTWAATPEATLTATMSWMTAPVGYPGDYLEGDVKNAAGVTTGRLKMGWISQFYRKMTVEIDTVAGSERPEDNGAGETWATVFTKVGFDVKVELSDTNVTKPTPDDSYSDAEMHAAMLARRDPINLDSEWHYHVLAVHHIESTNRGIMYDWQATDSNHVPREGLGIASHWHVHDIPLWGDLRNTRWGASKAAYFRTVIHELGHAFGLEHNGTDNGYMRPSPDIAAQPGGPFPRQIKWAYADDDLKRLRHWSDMFIRPGGLQFTAGYTTTLPITPTDLNVEMPDLELIVKPLLTEVPLGAPVRIELELTNHGDMPINVPESINLKSPFITGTVVSAGVEARTFKPMLHCTDSRPMKTLDTKKSIKSSLTLLRGAEGPLFPIPGVSEIKVTLNWPLEEGHSRASVIGSATVFITTATDPSHTKAAHKMLTTPDAHVLLVLGGDCERLKSGKEAIDLALADKTLRPHYVAVEAKRLATKFFEKQDLRAAEKLVREHQPWWSSDERKKLEKLGVKCGEQ